MIIPALSLYEMIYLNGNSIPVEEVKECLHIDDSQLSRMLSEINHSTAYNRIALNEDNSLKLISREEAVSRIREGFRDTYQKLHQ